MFRLASQVNQQHLHGGQCHRNKFIFKIWAANATLNPQQRPAPGWTFEWTSHATCCCLTMTLCSAVRQVRPQLGGFRVTHRWTLGMPIKTFNESRRASKRQSGQTWEKVYWNPWPSPGARTAAFGFSAHLIHFSVWLLGGQPESDGSGQKNVQKNLSNEEMKMFACIA